MFYKGEEVEVLEDGENLTKILDNRGTEFWARNELLSETQVGSVGAGILSLQPVTLDAQFSAELQANPSAVKIRIHYPKHAEKYVTQLFQREGISLPEDIRPINSGSRGGTEVQRTLAGEMWYQTSEGKQKKLSSLAIILAALKAGFPLTTYTKY